MWRNCPTRSGIWHADAVLRLLQFELDLTDGWRDGTVGGDVGSANAAVSNGVAVPTRCLLTYNLKVIGSNPIRNLLRIWFTELRLTERKP